ncbi:MAG: aconitate hydratase AcnA [Opitutales bacterium]
MSSDPFNVCQPFESKAAGKSGYLYSLPALEAAGVGKVSELPVSIRIVLESVLRNCDGVRVKEEDVRDLANWNPADPSSKEIPFVVSRIVLQDFTGVPLLVDLAAMRDAAEKAGKDPGVIEPLVPVDLVVDHSVQVDRSGTPNAFLQNMQREFERNKERYEFLKWGQQAFKTFSVVPPAIGIVHQVNLEYLAKVVFEKEEDGRTLFYPDSLVGTDSHTTMINGLGVVGWGVGGIEAEAGMLGQPITFQTPEVIGVNLTGELTEGVTATDLTLRITQLLRQEKVVGKFVEFHGEGAKNLTLADRATIANMAPEYGATMGFFPIDEQTVDYLRMTGRSEEQLALVRDYLREQGLFGMPKGGELAYSKTIDLDLGTVVPAVAGPKRPQDLIALPDLKPSFLDLLSKDPKEGGFGIADNEFNRRVPLKKRIDSGEDEQGDVVTADTEIGHGSVLIAAITSCTNTSNPSVMIAAGLVARKAVEKGLTVDPVVKTSLAPGSRVVTDYLEATGLQDDLNALGFNLVGYGCTTCIGNSGPLDDEVEAAIKEGNLVAASVLSGNRNFEARVHGSIRANFLMSPPLVVAYALAGQVDIDLDSDPIGEGADGTPVYLKDLWPTRKEIQEQIVKGVKPEMFQKKYSDILEANPQWKEIPGKTGVTYDWDKDSTYIQNPPFFEDFGPEPKPVEPYTDMRPLLLLGDSVTTDHISPAGSIPKDGPAGKYLLEHGVEQREFNSFGSRRGNDRIMTRGTFANVRIKNLMAEGKEGGYTKLQPEGELTTVYDAAMTYAERGTPLIVIAGDDYGMGSSRDWAAKGTALLGVRTVVATSFERIHRSNLIGMGVLPLQFREGDSARSLGLDGTETFSLGGIGDNLEPGQAVELNIRRADGSEETVTVTCRIDTAIEVDYYKHGGILQYVLRQLLGSTA